MRCVSYPIAMGGNGCTIPMAPAGSIKIGFSPHALICDTLNPVTNPSICERALMLYSRIAPTERGGYRLARAARKTRDPARWRDVFRTPDGFDIELDISDYPDACMAYGLYELDTARLIRRLLRGGDHVVDCGANIGYFTMLAATRVGPGGKVDAFEPQADNFERLRENLRRNDLLD